MEVTPGEIYDPCAQLIPADEFQSTKSYQPINFAQKYGLFAEQWQPKVVAELNDYQFKLARIEGAVTVKPGEMFVVNEGVEHKPYAATEVKMMLIEPRGVENTGSARGERTAQNDFRI